MPGEGRGGGGKPGLRSGRSWLGGCYGIRRVGCNRLEGLIGLVDEVSGALEKVVPLGGVEAAAGEFNEIALAEEIGEMLLEDGGAVRLLVEGGEEFVGGLLAGGDPEDLGEVGADDIGSGDGEGIGGPVVAFAFELVEAAEGALEGWFRRWGRGRERFGGGGAAAEVEESGGEKKAEEGGGEDGPDMP